MGVSQHHKSLIAEPLSGENNPGHCLQLLPQHPLAGLAAASRFDSHTAAYWCVSGARHLTCHAGSRAASVRLVELIRLSLSCVYGQRTVGVTWLLCTRPRPTCMHLSPRIFWSCLVVLGVVSIGALFLLSCWTSSCCRDGMPVSFMRHAPSTRARPKREQNTVFLSLSGRAGDSVHALAVVAVLRLVH